MLNKELNPKIILSLTIDVIFKIYFGSPKNLPELKKFLKAHLNLSDEELSTIQVLNPIILGDKIDAKSFTVDLLLKLKSGDIIHIEMQMSSHESVKERFQLYNARKAGEQIKSGEDYSKVRRTISLIVANFNVFPDSKKSHEKILMRRENGEIFTDAQELNIIDLTKVETDEETSREKYLWSKLFKAKTREELEMIASESEEWSAAANKVLILSADERARAYADSHEYSEYSRGLREHGIRKEAIKQGIKQGIDIGKVEIAKNLLAMGIAIEDISKATGLSASELRGLDK